MNVRDLMQIVAGLWPCTPKEYPPMADMSHDQRKRLERHHTVLHQLKAVGRLADTLEAYDHGNPLDQEALRKAIGTMFMNTACIAVACNVTPEELEIFFKEKSKNLV